jgi:NAD-dependent SIR2 family protein deacetylase
MMTSDDDENNNNNNKSSNNNNNNDNVYRNAAEILLQADYLLILAGAGMSADSGLQTYETMSEKYKKYCNPMKLIGVGVADDAAAATLGQLGDEDEKNKNELELEQEQDEQKEFQKFWYNFAINYTNTKPHKGYDILNNWCQGKKLKRLNSDSNSNTKTCSKANAKAKSKKWWVYTSNVDGHFCRYPSFQRSSSSNNNNGNVCEIHGCASSFRCSCRIGHYNAAATDYDYDCDDNDKDNDEEDEEQQLKLKPRMGDMWNRWNERVNEVMTDRCHNNVVEVHDGLVLLEGEEHEQPILRQCKECNTLPMRPNVLLFHDTDINILNSIQKQRIQYQQWEAIIEDELIGNNIKKPNNTENQNNQSNDNSKSTNFVLMEIGCGKNVPAVRNESEEILKDCMDILALARTASATVANNNDNDNNNNKNNESTVTLIRINPKDAGIDDDDDDDDDDGSNNNDNNEDEEQQLKNNNINILKSSVISIYETSLKALQLIDEELDLLLN